MRNVELLPYLCADYSVVVLRGELDTTSAEAVAVEIAALTEIVTGRRADGRRGKLRWRRARTGSRG